MNYIMRNLDERFWRKVKATAALQGLNVKELILKLLEREVKKLGK